MDIGYPIWSLTSIVMAVSPTVQAALLLCPTRLDAPVKSLTQAVCS